MPTRTSLPVPLMLMLLMCVPFAAQAQNTASRGADEQAIAQLNLEALTAFDKGDAKMAVQLSAHVGTFIAVALLLGGLIYFLL